MAGSRQNAASTVIPAMLYHDVAGASEWLCNVIGFTKHRVEANDDGEVEYAELSFGDSLIMVGSVRDPDYSRFMVSPDQASGSVTQTCYLIVDDLDALYARVQAADARIVLDLSRDGRGERCFSCMGFEGHIWSFGTYSPLGTVHEEATQQSQSRDVPNVKRQRSKALVGMSVLAMLFIMVAGWFVLEDTQQFFGSTIATASIHGPLEEQVLSINHKEASRRRIQLAGLQQNQLRANSAAVEKLKERLVAAEEAGTTANARLQEAQRKAEQLEAENNQALKANEKVTALLQAAQTDKDAAERANVELRRQLAPLQKSKQLTDASITKLKAQLLAAQDLVKEAERKTHSTRSRLAKAETEKEKATDAVKEVETRLLAAQTEKGAAERASRELRKQLASLKEANKLAEASASAQKSELAAAQLSNKETKLHLKKTRLKLAALTAANREVRKSAKSANERLSALQSDKLAMERVIKSARAQLAQMQRTKEETEDSARELQAQLLTAQSARETVEREMHEAQSKLARARLEKESAAQTVQELKRRMAALHKSTQISKRLQPISTEAVSTELLSHWAKQERARLEVLNRLKDLSNVAETIPPSHTVARVEAGERDSAHAERRPRLAKACVAAVQGKIPTRYMGSTKWDAASLARLCRGAGSSVEPAKCFERLMSGEIWWGAGYVWSNSNAFALCARTKRANRTITCFNRHIAQGKTWRESISRCRTQSKHVKRRPAIDSAVPARPDSRN